MFEMVENLNVVVLRLFPQRLLYKIKNTDFNYSNNPSFMQGISDDSRFVLMPMWITI